MENACICLAVFAAAALTGTAGDIVRNGGFDAGTPPKADGWDLGSCFKLEESCGMNGARGIHWQRSVAARSEIVGQYVDLKPGRIYDFTAWVRTKGLKGVGADGVTACATLLLTVCDKDGGYVCEYYTNRAGDTNDQWTRIKGRTARLPPNAARVKLSPFVWHNATGEAWFDDIVVTEVETKPLVGLYSDAYRDLAWEGDVTFRAMLALDPDATPLDTLKLEFVHFDGGEDSVRLPIADFTRSDAAITVPVGKLPLGKFPVTVELRKRADDSLVASESLMFERTKTAPKRACWIDRRNRLIVDGKPFFPLGCYFYTVNDKILDTYGKSGFNTVMLYPYCGGEVYDLIGARGLRAIACAKDFTPGNEYAPRKYRTQEDADRGLLARVERLKGNKSIIAWYVNDESPISQKDRLVRQYRYVRERDPDHPAWALLYQHDQIRDYKPTCDIIGTDPYPIAQHPIAQAAEYTRETRGSFLDGPVWMVPQAFAWKWWIEKAEGDAYRMPTKAEMRSMGWQMIANGANGVIYYCLGTMLVRMKPTEFEESWAGLCEISKEMARFIPVLLSDEDAPSVTGFAKGTSGRCWKKDGKTCLLVVNETREKIRTDLTLGASFSSVRPVMGADECRAEFRDGKLAVGLKPLACAMLEIE